jgi:magnesium-transporting ATPase (P-type)
VETLGATTFICTDKTGTLTQNRMNVVDVVTPAGWVVVEGTGYRPAARFDGDRAALAYVAVIARAATSCVTGRVVERDDWVADGDPMEAALHCLALRSGAPLDSAVDPIRRPYTPHRMLSSSIIGGEVSVLGAPEAVIERCRAVPASVKHELARLTNTGRRVVAVARRTWTGVPGEAMEHSLELLGLIGLEDPPRPDVGAELNSCRDANIRVAMLTGDHPGTAAAIAREIGLLRRRSCGGG